ncbi:MAG: response regulator [Rhodothermaceae bacterium]
MAKVMVVDDAGIVRSMLKKFLTNGGHEIICEAGNGVEAIEKYKEFKPELVTMDMSMPEMGGITAVEKIKEFDPRARIIMISAINQKELIVKALKAGVINYIIKPFDEEKLNSTIKETLESIS